MVINLWSSPRNISTALMYSFAQRADMQVVDEPFYAHYLKFTGVQRPDRVATLAVMQHNPDEILRTKIFSDSKKHKFVKNISVQLIGLNDAFIKKCQNIILIRHPKDTLLSYTKVIKQPTIDDIGFKHQYDIYKKWHTKGAISCIVNSNDLLKNPELFLTKICKKLKLDFDKNMLNWQKGARPEDGPWAKYWYENVHKSTGFKPFNENPTTLPNHLLPLYNECLPYYNFLNNLKLT